VNRDFLGAQIEEDYADGADGTKGDLFYHGLGRMGGFHGGGAQIYEDCTDYADLSFGA
jgi:hypothetical protein